MFGCWGIPQFWRPVLAPVLALQNWLHITVVRWSTWCAPGSKRALSAPCGLSHARCQCSETETPWIISFNVSSRLHHWADLLWFTHFFGGVSPGVDVVSKQLLAYKRAVQRSRQPPGCRVFCCAQRQGGTSEPPYSGLSSWHVPDKSRKEHTFEKF